MSTFKIAAVQAAPVFLNREATVAKACDLIREAGENGARLVVFPEAFIPAYPDWVWALPPGRTQLQEELYGELLDQAVAIPSPATEALGRAAQQAGAYVAVGVNERNVEASDASLYNTLLYLDPDGRVMGKHRKLVPTGGERLVWAQGDGSTLAAYDTPLGKLGGLICWENYMPLARYAMYAWGVQLYLAPTWDRGKPWLRTLQHIAREGRLYVVGCCIALRLENIPDRYAFKEAYAAGDEWINKGDSAIVGPDGEFIAGPLHKEAGILYADVSLQKARGAKWMLDVAGHYGRADVFNFAVNRTAHTMMKTAEAPAPPVPREDQVGSGAAKPDGESEGIAFSTEL